MSQRRKKSFNPLRVFSNIYHSFNIKYFIFLITISVSLIWTGVEIHKLHQFTTIDRHAEYLATQERLAEEIHAIQPEIYSLQKACNTAWRCTPEKKLALNTLLAKEDVLKAQKRIPYFPANLLNASLVEFTNAYPWEDSGIYNAWVQQSHEQGKKTRYVQIQIFKILMVLFLFIYLMKLFRKYFS